LQAAFSLGAWPLVQTEPVLRELAARSDGDEVLRIAVMSSLPAESPLFGEMKRNAPIPKPVALAALKPSSDDRARVIASYAGVEKLTGDAMHGRLLFQAICVNCHRLRGEGNEVGPDLGMVGTKPVDWLLTAILDPSQAIEARYRGWTIKLKSGEELTGLLAAETANNFVLRLVGGVDHAVLRSAIAAMEPMKLSLMPNGLESALKPQDMADLLRWLQSP
jgi:putative heme-binding domain-containing protein